MLLLVINIVYPYIIVPYIKKERIHLQPNHLNIEPIYINLTIVQNDHHRRYIVLKV
mgnify:CR=1 FL=1